MLIRRIAHDAAAGEGRASGFVEGALCAIIQARHHEGGLISLLLKRLQGLTIDPLLVIRHHP